MNYCRILQVPVAVIVIPNRRPSQQQQHIITINMDYQGNRRMPVMLAILVVEMVVGVMKDIGGRPRN